MVPRTHCGIAVMAKVPDRNNKFSLIHSFFFFFLFNASHWPLKIRLVSPPVFETGLLSKEIKIHVMTGHLHVPSHTERNTTLKIPSTQLSGKGAAVESVDPTESQFRQKVSNYWEGEKYMLEKSS